MATVPSAEDQQRERAVFDDDDGYSEGDYSDLDDDDDTDPDDDPRRQQQQQQQQEQQPPPTDPLPASAVTDSLPVSASASAAAPTALAPQNGCIPLLTPCSATPSEIKIEERRALVPFDDSRRALVPFDDSRRLFQRLWTDDDEIKILRGFLEFTTQRGTTFASHQYDTGPFYEQIKRELQLDFTKNQLIEKLRRLKKKFRNAATKVAAGKEFVFKSPHDQATFEISRKIWSVGLKRSRESDDDDLPTAPATEHGNGDATFGTAERRLARSRRRIRRRMDEAAVEVPVIVSAVEDSAKPILAPPSPIPIPTLIEETVKSCLGPLFKELLNSAVRAPGEPGLSIGAGGLPLNQLLPLSFTGISVNPPGSMVGGGDKKWRKQQILELEVYLKRIELLQEQIKSTLEKLKSSPES